jgi:cellulose synthase/poly-beta-1,6-N-acetylglucosamine synthase-like glycosyltransferase
MAVRDAETHNPKIIVVMPAYNAAKTLKITYDAIPHQTIDQIILVDDGSTDKTLEIARALQLTVFVHTRNFGYGANQKTCYTEALKEGADIIVMLHPDYSTIPLFCRKSSLPSRPARPTLCWVPGSCPEARCSRECHGGNFWGINS